MRAIIVGATGATGIEVVKNLLLNREIKNLTAFCRSALAIEHPKLSIQTVDFENFGKWESLISADIAFSCLGTTLKQAGSKKAQWQIDYEYQYRFAQIAKANGISHFVLLSAANANANSNLFFSKMKGKLERDIEALHFEQLTIFQPGMLDRPNSDRPLEKIAVQTLSFLNKLGLFGKLQPISTEKLGAKIAASALNQQKYSKRIYTSGELIR